MRLIKLKKVFFIIILLSLLELILRLQQAFGPLYDLEMKNIFADFRVISDQLNHRCVGCFIVEGIKKCYDEQGIRRGVSYSRCADVEHCFRVLFMGDSFMEGYEEAHTVPQIVSEYIRNKHSIDMPMEFLNAGCGTYSPAIYIPQAKMLIPSLKPDFIVIDIDETDLGDDYIRYKNLIVRDAQGKIIAVRHTPIYYKFIKGFVNIRRQPLYCARLISKIIHTRIYTPIIQLCYRKEHYSDIVHACLKFSREKEAKAAVEYINERSFFEKNLSELFETLINLMGNKERILVVSHPYLQQLTAGVDGCFWNTFVPDTVKKISDKYGIQYYNATEDLRKAFNNQPRLYYGADNIHFTRTGLRIFAECLAKKFYTYILPLISSKNL